MPTTNSQVTSRLLIVPLFVILLLQLFFVFSLTSLFTAHLIALWISIFTTILVMVVSVNKSFYSKAIISIDQNQENKLVKSQRLYFFLSQINQAMVKIDEEAALYKEICNVAVDIGQFRMAWIGTLDVETGFLIPVAHAGEERGYLDGIEISSSADIDVGKGPSGSATREGRFFYANNIAEAPEMAPWRKAALARNYQSIISLPIFKNQVVVGAFTLYADSINFFDEAEIKLLQEATGDLSFALDILEKEKWRKKTELELKESKQRYQTLAEVAPVGIFHTDKTGYTTYVNPCWSDISGMTSKEAEGDGWLNGLHPDDRVPIKDGWALASTHKKASHSEYRFVKKDGSIAWVMGQAVPEKNNQGDIVGYIGTITDITERKIYEQKIEKLYREKQNILSRINDSMVSLDSNWCYTFLNDAAMPFHPDGRENTLGRSVWEVHPELKGTIFWNKYHEAKESGKSLSFASYYKAMDKWFSVKVYPSSDGLTIFFNDISERILNEEKILLNETRLKKAQEIGGLGYWQMEVNSSYIWASEEVMRIYGLPAVEGKIRRDKISSCMIDLDVVRAAVKQILKDHQPYRIQFSIQPIDSNKIKHIEAMAELGLDEKGEPLRIMGVLHDITDQVNAQKEITFEKNLSDSIISSLPGIFYLYTIDGRFLRWNKKFEIVTEYNAAEIKDMHPLDFYDDPEKQLLKQKISSVFQTGEDAFEAMFLTKSGKKIPYYFTGCRLLFGGEACLVGIGIDFSDRKQAVEELGQITQQLRDLTIHLQNVREEERKRIGREIHDELGQQLTAMKMDVVWLDKKMDPSNELFRSKLKNLITLLDGSNQSVRRILSELRPLILDDRGLVDALQWLGSQFESLSGVSVEFEADDITQHISEEIKTTLFRVYQEALTNVSRYAKASTLLSSLRIEDDTIVLRITDDGIGFEQEILKQKKSFGILGMKERANALGGIFTLYTTIGKGTTIIVRIPIFR